MEQWRQKASDVALAARAMQGDALSFGELSERCRPLVFATCLRVLHERDTAADATQETLLVALEGVRDLRSPLAFGPWLRAIAERTALRLARRPDRADRQAPALHELASDEAGPEAWMLSRETAEVVWCALERLEPEDRETIALRYLAGRSVDEVAGWLGLTRDGAKYRLRRATARLRSALRPYVEGDRPDGVCTGERPGSPGRLACGG